MTECNEETFAFTAHFSRRVEAAFNAAQVSSDGGALLLPETERKINLLGRLAARFSDGRDAERIAHGMEQMLAQRIYGLALGYVVHIDQRVAALAVPAVVACESGFWVLFMGSSRTVNAGE